MKTVQQAAAEIASAASSLHDAIADFGNPDYVMMEAALNERVQVFVSTPTMTITQAFTDAVGTHLLELERAIERNLDIDLIDHTDPLHNLLSQTMVDHAPDLDWYQSAQVKPPASGMNQPRSGSKHKPAES